MEQGALPMESVRTCWPGADGSLPVADFRRVARGEELPGALSASLSGCQTGWHREAPRRPEIQPQTCFAVRPGE
jgi:hypothetical protein